MGLSDTLEVVVIIAVSMWSVRLLADATLYDSRRDKHQSVDRLEEEILVLRDASARDRQALREVAARDRRVFELQQDLVKLVTQYRKEVSLLAKLYKRPQMQDITSIAASTDALPSNLACPICMVAKVDCVRRFCGHAFCDACLSQIDAQACPVCRSPDTGRMPIYLP